MLVEQHVKQHAWPEVHCVKYIYYIYIYVYILYTIYYTYTYIWKDGHL